MHANDMLENDFCEYNAGPILCFARSLILVYSTAVPIGPASGPQPATGFRVSSTCLNAVSDLRMIS